MDSKTHITNLVAIAAAIVLLLLCLLMTGRITQKVALTVDQIELTNRDTLTIGQNSDIYYHNVPMDYLTVWKEGSHYKWKVNDQYQDSLQYFKINNENPNKHIIHDDESQRIVLTLPTSMGDTLRMTLTGKEIWKAWKKRFANQKEVMARHFAANCAMATDSIAASDSLKMLYMNQMQRHDVRSFFQKGDDALVLVILDRFTKIQEKDSEGKEALQGYVREGQTADEGEKAGHCKVQFFSVGTHCYLDKSPEAGTFQVDGVNYVMKASVKLTEWGAGHVMITPGRNDKSMLISFPKPITYVGTVDSLRSKSKRSSGVITLKQNNHSFPNKSDLYLPAFSNAINFDLCNIEFRGESVLVRDNNYDSILVENATTAFLPFSVMPALNPVTLHSGNDLLHARVGYISHGFFLSYLWLPLLVFVLLMLIIWLPISPLKVSRPILQVAYNPDQLRNYRGYLSLLLGICLLYCVCKSMIAVKLSYTYPYFEKLTGITPVATAAMMLLMFTLAMLLNTPFLHMNAEYKDRRGRRHHRKSRLLMAWGGCALIFAILAYAFFGVMDRGVSAGMLSSYFRSETFIWQIWRWPSTLSVGVNDTHRSVVYTLLFIEAVTLALWLIVILGYDFLVKWVQAAKTWLQGLSSRLIELVGVVAGKVRSHHLYQRLQQVADKAPSRHHAAAKRLLTMLVAAAVLILYGLLAWISPLPGIPGIVVLMLLAFAALYVCCGFVRDACVGMLKTLFPGHFALLLLIIIAGESMGNFGTAFITLAVVVGLSRALSSTAAELSSTQSRPRYTILIQMLLIVLVYTACAMFGDNGYMTNFLGFVMCMTAFFFMVKRPQAYVSREVSTQTRQERRWVNITLAAVCIMVWLMPTICSKLFNPENVDYSRLSRRVMLYSNFDDLQRSGYRYSESDAEFMVIMSHYMQGDSLGSKDHDPLSNEAHFMHPSVSSGQSPVALNDLSVPIAFFGSYNRFFTHLVYFSLLALLMWVVMRHTVFYTDRYKPLLTNTMQWRLLAMFMWVGTSLYIYFSYIDWLPFTGRLNPGFGVDAVGEALETAFLLAFMATVTGRKRLTDNH